jgi:hypothetical protein
MVPNSYKPTLGGRFYAWTELAGLLDDLGYFKAVLRHYRLSLVLTNRIKTILCQKSSLFLVLLEDFHELLKRVNG